MKAKTVLLLSLAFMISSCNNNIPKESDNTLSESSKTYVENFEGDNMKYKDAGHVQGAIHQFNKKEKDGYVLKNGQTEYKVLISSNASKTMQMNIQEFTSLFYEATNVDLEIINDSTLIDNNGKYFAIGENKFFKDNNVSMDYNQIKSQGYIIKTVNNAIVMSGYSEQACLNAMYQYLYDTVNYLFLGPDSYIIDKNVKNISLYDYDFIDAPDIEYRIGSNGFVDSTSSKRYRLIEHNEHVIAVNGNHYHNTFDYLPPSKYKNEHPEWYSIDGTQLCYTARGNSQSLKAMQDIVFNVMTEHLIKYPTNTAITFTIQDMNTFCTCDTCKAENEKYNGSNAAMVIKFLNVISDRINDWFENEGKAYKRDLKILFFAYLSTNIAPTHYDKTTDTYTPIDSEVICRDNVCPFFCDVRGDYTKSYYDDNSANVTYARNMKAWTSCCKNLYFWKYGTNFVHYLTPYNCYDAMIDTYKYAVECGAMYLFEQQQFNQGPSSTGWHYVKQYLTARASWDCNVNITSLYDEFFSEFYSKEASSIMRGLFDEYLQLANYQSDVLGYNGSGSIYHNPFQEKYWPKQTLIKWINRFDDALKEIEVYKESNPGKYDIYKKHIIAERVQYIYLLVKTYQSSLSEDELEMYKKQFHSDVDLTGIVYENESKSLASDLLN